MISPWEVTFVYLKGSGDSQREEEKTWTFRDSIGETAFALLDVVKPHFDGYIEGSLDDAGGSIVGFMRFFIKNPEIFDKNIANIQNDEYLSKEYLCRFLSYPGCVCSSIDTGVIKKPSQLNIHFFVSESDHGELSRHALESAIITSVWFPEYDRYMVGYRHLRMLPGIIRFTRDELVSILENKLLPKNVMENVIKRGDLLLFKANFEDIDLESVKRYRYPLIDGKNWKLREIKDASNEEYKRFRANLYVEENKSKKKIILAVQESLEQLKNVENPPCPTFKIKYGSMEADAVYLHVFRKRSRRKNRVISPENSNFICLVEWHSDKCLSLEHGGIPKLIWDQLKKEKNNDVLFSWNPHYHS